MKHNNNNDDKLKFLYAINNVGFYKYKQSIINKYITAFNMQIYPYANNNPDNNKAVYNLCKKQAIILANMMKNNANKPLIHAQITQMIDFMKHYNILPHINDDNHYKIQLNIVNALLPIRNQIYNTQNINETIIEQITQTIQKQLTNLEN